VERPAGRQVGMGTKDHSCRRKLFNPACSFSRGNRDLVGLGRGHTMAIRIPSQLVVDFDQRGPIPARSPIFFTVRQCGTASCSVYVWRQATCG
jgi:hypothetical protein